MGCARIALLIIVLSLVGCGPGFLTYVVSGPSEDGPSSEVTGTLPRVHTPWFVFRRQGLEIHVESNAQRPISSTIMLAGIVPVREAIVNGRGPVPNRMIISVGLHTQYEGSYIFTPNGALTFPERKPVAPLAVDLEETKPCGARFTRATYAREVTHESVTIVGDESNQLDGTNRTAGSVGA